MSPYRVVRFSLLLFSLVFSFFSGGVLRAEEFCGVWVASVWNLNYPSKPGLTAAEQKRQIVQLLEVVRAARLNHVLVQVRPEGCALYASKLEPWSRFLTGTQGVSPGFDPLQVFLEEGHKRGLKVHAWLNPYRASINAKNANHPAHPSRRFPEHTKKIGNLLWMDPGAPAVQQHVLSVVQDLLRRYPLDGIHYDDYFYPYPAPGKTVNFPDADSYAAYRQRGGNLALADWRRDNVNSLVRRTYQLVKSERPKALFGVSPFGIYTKGQPAEVKAGLDQLNQIYADPVRWMREGWVDYLAPQLYWKDGGPQSFSALLRWWRNPGVNPRRIPIYPGIALDRLGGSHQWPLSEIATQLRAEQAIGPRGPGGFILYNISPVASNTKGVRSLLSGR